MIIYTHRIQNNEQILAVPVGYTMPAFLGMLNNKGYYRDHGAFVCSLTSSACSQGI